MIQRAVIYLLATLAIIFILTFEASIGMPILFMYITLHLLQDQEGMRRIGYTLLFSLLLASSIQISVTLLFVLLAVTTLVIDKVKQKTVLQLLGVSSLCVVVIVFYGQLQLLPLSFVYFLLVWLLLSSVQKVRDVTKQASRVFKGS